MSAREITRGRCRMRTIRYAVARLFRIFLPAAMLACAAAIVAVAATPGPARELFGYKLDSGTGSATSLLGQRGYKVTFRQDRMFPRTSYAEAFHFSNEVFDDVQLSAHAWDSRVYTYQWEDRLLADPKEAALVKRLIQEISKAFGEPVVEPASTGSRPAVDASLLAAIATGEGDKDFRLIWKGGEEQVELSLLTPLLPDKIPRADLSVRYFLPKVEAEVLAYIRGDSGSAKPKP